jgi:DNA polymerase III alpha subunit
MLIHKEKAIKALLRDFHTQLNNRTLWYDGISSYNADTLDDILQLGKVKYVNSITPEVIEFNTHANVQDQMIHKQICNEISTQWNIPIEYQLLNIEEYVFEAHDILFNNIDPTILCKREKRLAEELLLFTKLNMIPIVRVVIWITYMLNSNNVVWGIGRGSSVSSYLLYIIGIHDVDSFIYDLPVTDFLRP